jgi:hypothetical protein
MMKFLLDKYMNQTVWFSTQYYTGIGEVRVLGNGEPGILTDKFIFGWKEIKKIKEVK